MAALLRPGANRRAVAALAEQLAGYFGSVDLCDFRARSTPSQSFGSAPRIKASDPRSSGSEPSKGTWSGCRKLRKLLNINSMVYELYVHNLGTGKEIEW